MILTEPMIRRIVPDADKVFMKKFINSFNEYSVEYGIDTKIRVAHYLSQSLFETDGMKSTPEMFCGMKEPQKMAMMYWRSNIGTLADDDDPRAVSIAVSGDEYGLAKRMYYYRMAKKVLCL